MDDVPRWACLLTPEERPLFFEVASHLWEIPVRPVSDGGTRTFNSEASLFLLQNLARTLVETSGLFETSPGSFWGTYRLDTLRQSDPPSVNAGDEGMEILPDGQFRPLLTPKIPESVKTDHQKCDPPKPPDSESDRLDILARVTILIAGAIFGAILLYLCCGCLRIPFFASLLTGK